MSEPSGPTPSDSPARPAQPTEHEPAPEPEPRPLIERIGLGAIAVVLATLFGGVSAASWAGGEPFLAVMAGIGALMTLWVGAVTVFRG